jgi:hypothetical protein
MTKKEELVNRNRRGLIHAPDESDAAFFARCRRMIVSPSAPKSDLANRLFDIAPDWIEIDFSTKGLRFWEGGCTWIDARGTTLQLHPAFQKKKTYLGYEQDEVIAHEFVHAVRSQFEEPMFEEVLAYRTSPSAFRRYWGPALRTTNESLITMISLTTSSIALFFEPLYFAALTAILGLIGGGICRLVRTQKIFDRALRKIAFLVGSNQGLAVMLRLTDREIIRFAKMEAGEIVAYATKMAKLNERWQQITASYFNK